MQEVFGQELSLVKLLEVERLGALQTRFPAMSWRAEERLISIG